MFSQKKSENDQHGAREAVGQPTDWLSSQAIADDLGVPIATYYAWRAAGKAPKAIRIGKYVRVRRCDYEAWLATLAEVTR